MCAANSIAYVEVFCDALREGVAVGFVTLATGSQAAAAEMRSWANERLGKVQRLSDVRVLEALPRSHIGKVLKRALRNGYRPARSRDGSTT